MQEIVQVGPFIKKLNANKVAISETVDLLHAYLHLPRTPFSWVTGM